MLSWNETLHKSTVLISFGSMSVQTLISTSHASSNYAATLLAHKKSFYAFRDSKNPIIELLMLGDGQEVVYLLPNILEMHWSLMWCTRAVNKL